MEKKKENKREKKQINIEIGHRIQEMRRHAGFTQERLSEAIDVTPQYLSDLERGVVGASVSTLIDICRTLNISSDYLLLGKNDDPDITVLIERLRWIPEEQMELADRWLNLLLDALNTPPPAKNSKAKITAEKKDL